MPPIKDMLAWQFGLRKAREGTHLKLPPYEPSYVRPDLSRINNPDPNTIQVTWVGHSTFLIQVAGLNILTDPIWSTRASPISWLGPRRVAHPGVPFTDLPQIDIVLVSHTHYDHLDRPTVLRLGDTPHYIVPERTKRWFANEHITNMTELAWGQKKTIEAVTITAVPAKHWSKRGFFRTNDAGWGGFVIESPVGSIYFAGDTGYESTYFREIGAHFPALRLALIPIGAYAPRWFMQRFHINPAEALLIHQETGARQSIGMHWGTFNLSEEPTGEPPILLAREVANARMAPDDFSTMTIGETRVFD